MTAPLAGIEHIVVVMFENRSFNNVLGALYTPSSDFWGVPAGANNIYKTRDGALLTVGATHSPPSGNSPFISPFPDPGESFDDMSTQIFGNSDGAGAPDMSGFAQNYYDNGGLLSDRAPGDIMFYFTPAQMKVTNTLASSYAVCDQWFASGPVQTFPNRAFCHCGTPSTYNLFDELRARVNDVDYIVDVLGHKMGKLAGSVTDASVFELLDAGSDPDPGNWKIYFHDAPMSLIVAYVNDAFKAGSPCLASFDGSDYDPPYGTSFATDVQNDALPKYAFIEPRYFDNYSTSGVTPSSNHPGVGNYQGLGGAQIDVRNGESLLASIVSCLTANPTVFDKTLLIVTYDEHGGVYDHVPPNSSPFAAAAPSPFADPQPANFDYTRYGVRVPMVLANPRIAAGTIYRPAAPGSGSFYPFDHTSIIATLCAQFGLKGHLTPRDASAPVLSGLVSSSAQPREPDPALDSVLQEALAGRSGAASPGPRLAPEEHDRRLVAWVRSRAATPPPGASR